MKIGIVGNGFVGKATSLLKSTGLDISSDIELCIYDIRPEACSPPGTTIESMEECDVVFLALPTPLNHDASCYTKILQDVISKIKNPFKVIRSTVNVGFSEKYSCFFMPEFLTERNWKQDFIEAPYWAMGLLNETQYDDEKNEKNKQLNNLFREKIQQLFSLSCQEKAIQSDKIYFMENKEAETLKLFKNCFLSAKVGIMNEFYDFCNAYSVDYENVKNMLIKDNRIGSTHVNVPGYEGIRGFGGTCFPKDTHSLYSQFQKKEKTSPIYENILYRNDLIDRPQREWATDLWRTTIPTDKKISLVTGGAGFIGSHLCKRLISEDHIVICVDNFSSGNMDNIKSLLTNENFFLKKADVIHKLFFPKLDYIWHLACVASPPQYMSNGYHTIQTSVTGTMNMIELAETHKCNLLFTSTSEIYGDPLEHPQHENYYGNVNCVGPRSCYDEGKRCAETLLYQYRMEHPDMADKLKIVRIFNTYGPNMDLNDGRVITNFMNSILKNEKLTIYGDGSQTRSFIYIDDMINGLHSMMFSNEVGPINLGNPNEEHTILELKTMIEEILDKKLNIEFLDLPKDDPTRRKPDINRAETLLNWTPKVLLKDGLSNMLYHFNIFKNEENIYDHQVLLDTCFG